VLPYGFVAGKEYPRSTATSMFFRLHMNPAGKIYKGIKARFWAAGNIFLL